MAIQGLESGAALALIEVEIGPARINSLGHMRASEYVALFDDAFLAFVRLTGITGPDLRHGTTSPFLLDLHATYLKELGAGDRVAISAQALDVDPRRARLMLLMHTQPATKLAATCELAILNMDMASRRPVPWSVAQMAAWGELRAAHASLPLPAEAGRAIGPLG